MWPKPISLPLVATVAVIGAACSNAPAPRPAGTEPVGAAVLPDDASDGCSAGLLTEAQLGPARGGTETTVERLLSAPPRSGRFTLTAYAEKRHHCAPCAAPASCKPCEDTIWVFESFGTGLKQPFEESADLVVHVPNAAPFDHSQIRLTVVACPGEDAATKRPRLQLVGYDAPTR